MKARYKYRIYPTKYQQTKLAQLFGCVRVVWNDNLACCQKKYARKEKKPVNSELQKQFITQAKKTEDREWLSEFSTIPLQQSLNDLNLKFKLARLYLVFNSSSINQDFDLKPKTIADS